MSPIHRAEGGGQRVEVQAGQVVLEGDLRIPDGARGMVLFAHGSGSSRHSPRNRYVAGVLEQAQLATVLLDLLSVAEVAVDLRTGHLRFDIGLLAERLVAAVDWLSDHEATQALPLGLFGASTGAAAALVAAAQRPERVGAVVSRGGRPDLAGATLPHVEAPVLLIVGGADIPVISMNRQAMAQLRCQKRLDIIPGATHLFEEPGAIEDVAVLAAAWFNEHLRQPPEM